MRIFFLFTVISINLSISACKTSKRHSSDCQEVTQVYYCEDEICSKKYHGHIDTIYKHMPPDMIYNMSKVIEFPLKVKIVARPNIIQKVTIKQIERSVKTLNQAFLPAAIQFSISEINTLHQDISIEDITEDDYARYQSFSNKNDALNAITLYLMDDNENYCSEDNGVISCHRVHGFTYILDQKYPNIVLSKNDITNEKILPHEMGHYFGLYHTHRTAEGKESILRSNCEYTGDHLCSTPADPGISYGLYVDYTQCEMFGLKNNLGYEYKPLIENYMSYYYPCYKRAFSFSEEQYIVMRTAALSNIRNYQISNIPNH